MRRIDETVKSPTTEIRYIPSKWDESQLTEIVIKPAKAATQTIYMKMRDKYQFKVGTSLTL